MKNMNTLPAPDPGQGVLAVPLEFQSKPLLVHGDAEVISGLYEAVKHKTYKVPDESHTEAPQPALPAKPEYVSLAQLSDREIARRSLRAFMYDVRTLGRNNEYKRFQERVQAERDLAMDMELGIVQSVHCRLHEKLLAHTE